MQNVENIVSFITALGVIMAAGAYAFDRYSKSRKEVVKDTDEREEKLINVLKSTVDALERKQTENVANIQGLQGRVTELEVKNKIITDIFQGRDDQTLRFQKEGFEAIKRTEQIVTICAKNNTNILKLYEMMKLLHDDFQKAISINK